ELYVIGPDGNERGFITGQERIGGINWHPDSRRVTFLARRGDDATSRLYAIPVDGGEAQVLMTMESDIGAYSLSPDGNRVALLAFEPEDEALREEREQGFSQLIFEEDWQPRRLWIAELNDGDDEPEMLELDGSVQSVSWSPAGDRLMVGTAPRELVDDVMMFQTIRIITPGGEELGVVETEGKLGQSVWSPNGSRIAFVGAQSINDTREGRLMVVDADGGAPQHLLPDLEGHVWHLDWLDDNT